RFKLISVKEGVDAKIRHFRRAAGGERPAPNVPIVARRFEVPLAPNHGESAVVEGGHGGTVTRVGAGVDRDLVGHRNARRGKDAGINVGTVVEALLLGNPDDDVVAGGESG